MKTDNPRAFRGRLAELSPFEIKLAETPKAAAHKSTAAWHPHNVSAEELYGCVDWYQYSAQFEREPEKEQIPI